MASETVVIDSSLAPDVAFDRLIDLTRVPEWDRGVTESRLVAGTAGTVGARYAVGLTGFDRRPTTAEYELTSVGERTFTMVGEHPEFRAEDTVTVDESEGGCRVTYVAGLQLRGDDPPLTDDQLDVTFSKLVAVVEAGLTGFLAAES
ncbi:MAG: SRPBCC family protein [Actinomycetota bacterium]